MFAVKARRDGILNGSCLRSLMQENWLRMASEADLRNGFIECDFNEVGTDRSW